jgi:hypothetical protein
VERNVGGDIEKKRKGVLIAEEDGGKQKKYRVDDKMAIDSEDTDDLNVGLQVQPCQSQ